MSYSTNQLESEFKELIFAVSARDVQFERIASVNDFNTDSLVFVDDSTQLPLLQKMTPAVLVTTASLQEKLNQQIPCVITVENVRLAQAKIKQYYDDYDSTDSEWDAIHCSAVIHKSATLSKGVRVGPNVTIGANVKVGENTHIRAGSVIEHDACIGNDCVINSLVNIGYATEVGDRVILHPGVVIGAEGFGFAPDGAGHFHRVPHTGKVVIEDDVVIGSNSTVDRGTYGETRLKNGVKLDALCHIAHNVEVGDHSVFAAQCGIAGSSKIGKHVLSSGRTAIVDHRTIADNVVLVHKAGVTQDIVEAGTYAGVPAKPMKEYVRDIGVSKRLERLQAQLKELQRQIKESGTP